jgi:hypothetical protein
MIIKNTKHSDKGKRLGKVSSKTRQYRSRFLAEKYNENEDSVKRSGIATLREMSEMQRSIRERKYSKNGEKRND